MFLWKTCRENIILIIDEWKYTLYKFIKENSCQKCTFMLLRLLEFLKQVLCNLKRNKCQRNLK